MKKVVTQITGCLKVRSRLKNPGFRIMSPILYEPRSVFSGVRRKLNKEPGEAAAHSCNDGSQTVLQAGQYCTVSKDSRKTGQPPGRSGAHLRCHHRANARKPHVDGIRKLGWPQLPQTVAMVPIYSLNGTPKVRRAVCGGRACEPTTCGAFPMFRQTRIAGAFMYKSRIRSRLSPRRL